MDILYIVYQLIPIICYIVGRQFEVVLPDTFYVICLLIPIVWYISEQYMKYTEREVARMRQEEIIFEERLQVYINQMVPGVVTVPEGPSGSVLKTDQIIGKCATCLAPAAARCSGCKSVPYCSRRCQLIHWSNEHNEICHKILHPYTDAMDSLVGLNSFPHGEDIKNRVVQEGTSDNQFSRQTVKKYNISLKQKGVGTSKQVAMENEDGSDTNSWSSEELSGIEMVEENLENQEGTMSENTPQNQIDEKTKDSGQKNDHTNIQTGNNSLQTHEIKKLEEQIKKLEELKDELLNENNALRSLQNEYEKENKSLHQQLEKEASKNYDMTNFMEFSDLELNQATNNFDKKLKIGEGGYGGVYKGVLHCTPVAIKILKTGGTQGRREFYQEVEMLTKVRHPNIVTLIGGCSQNMALVYEFIPNGSLEKYLGAARGVKPLSWKTRIGIASNICSALVFLHSTKPHGIAHGDLKPANILLDANYQGKLSDFGISCHLVKAENTTTPLHLTVNPKGTIAYIDPEYMRTGEMNPQSDVYSFGVVLLQLVTGKPATVIIKLVQEDALQGQSLKKEIDASAKWPFDKANKLVKLGLLCCNPARKNRPNLATEVWSEIESLKADASN